MQSLGCCVLVCDAVDTASLATWFLFGKLFYIAMTFGFGEKRCRKNLPLHDLRPAEMKLLPTYNQILALMALAVWFMILSLLPHWGAPFFRYTGCDPDHHVWNLGWPMATCIYDSANSPYFFVGPLAYIYCVAGALGFTGLYVGFVAWNRFGHLLKWEPHSEPPVV